MIYPAFQLSVLLQIFAVDLARSENKSDLREEQKGKLGL